MFGQLLFRLAATIAQPGILNEATVLHFMIGARRQIACRNCTSTLHETVNFKSQSRWLHVKLKKKFLAFVERPSKIFGSV